MKQNSDLTQLPYLEHSSTLPVPAYSEIHDNEFLYVQVALWLQKTYAVFTFSVKPQNSTLIKRRFQLTTLVSKIIILRQLS